MPGTDLPAKPTRLAQKPRVTFGVPDADLDDSMKARATGLDRVSNAINAYRRTIRRALEIDNDGRCDDHALAFYDLIGALSQMKVAPTVKGLRDPSGVPWAYNVARKDGIIYVHFLDPDGGGDFLVPFSEDEIVNLD